MPYEAECEAAVEAAIRTAPFIRLHAGRLRAQDIRDKGTHDLVTFVDEESQHRILDILTSAFPEYGVLAEEGDDAQDEQTEERPCRWVVDPVDGTTNFTQGVSPFGISIGLQKGDEMVVGVVLEIVQDELFTATRGGGLFLNGRRVRVSTCKRLDQGVVTTGFPFRDHTSPYIDAYMGVLKDFIRTCHGVRRFGSASVDFAYVACGRLEGFFEIGLGPWDLAAGWLLVEEGGGRVTDMGGGLEHLSAGQVVASNGLVHNQMCRLVEPLHEALHGVASEVS